MKPIYFVLIMSPERGEMLAEIVRKSGVPVNIQFSKGLVDLFYNLQHIRFDLIVADVTGKNINGIGVLDILKKKAAGSAKIILDKKQYPDHTDFTLEDVQEGIVHKIKELFREL